MVRYIKPFDLIAYCLLYDHLHLLIGIREECKYDITNIIHSLKRNFTIDYKKIYKITHETSLWQKRFWDHIIRNENDFKKHMDYIHYNPVKHGITLKPEEYKYTSFNKWVENGFYEKGWGHSQPDDLTDIERVLNNIFVRCWLYKHTCARDHINADSDIGFHFFKRCMWKIV